MEIILLKALPIIIMGLWEYFLGKTKAITANSTIDLALDLAKKAIGR